MNGKTPDQGLHPDGSGLRLTLLGGFQCSLDGRAIEGVWYDKMRALLAYLAMQPAQDHARELLADLLWSGSDPVVARGNLRRTLSDLRRVLEPPGAAPVFDARKGSIRFVAESFVDARVLSTAIFGDAHDESALQRSERLASLYRGQFMAGFYLPACVEFEDWLLLLRESLHRRALALLEQLAQAHEQAGDVARALQAALRHADLERWDESVHRRVMRLYAASGQRSAALSQFESCRRVLTRDLGLVPSLATCTLAERIRDGDPQLTPPIPVRPRARAERRWVTVLFCELAASAIDDADEAVERLLLAQTHAVEMITRDAGHLVPMPGSGLLAYFGYPLSREHCALRAVRVAQSVAASAFDGIDVRCGIHSGLILTGANPWLPDALGQTSAAARLLSQRVDLRELAISRDTLGIVTGYFDCSALEATVAQPEAWRVDSARAARHRLDASEYLTPLAGRQAELHQLTASWTAARQGVARAVLLQGEPGIGKSRLVHAFKLQLHLQGETHGAWEWRCFAEYAQSPFYPVLAWIEGLLGFVTGEDAQAKADKLTRHVRTRYPTLAANTVPVLLALFSLPLDGPAQALSASTSKARTSETLCAFLQASMARKPGLLVVEDLHWADPSTIELLGAWLARPTVAPSLSIFTVRSGVALPFAVTVQSLAPLSAPEIAQLVASTGHALSEAAIQRIVERSDGVPFFAEELAKSATVNDGASIPGTLHEALAARMDALGDAKYTAQLAATIGRQFDIELLSELAPGGGDDLQASLAHLKLAGLLTESTDSTFQFRHALIQEAAYQSQSRADRRAAHLQIAQALRSRFADSVAAAPERVAQHLAQAGETRQSIDYWMLAGHRALRTSANLEAIAHFNSGLQWLKSLPPGSQHRQCEFALLAGLAAALHATQGYGSPEATEVGTRLSILRDALSASFEAAAPDLFLADWTRLRNTVATLGPRGVPRAAMSLASRVQGDPVRRQAAYYVASIACFWLGEFEASRAHASRALALNRPEQAAAMIDLFGEDLSVSFSGHLSWALCFLGFADQAQRVCERMLAQARAAAHPKTLAMALLFASMLMRWSNRPAELMRLSAETVSLTARHGMAHWLQTAESLNAWARAMHLGGPDALLVLERSTRLVPPPSAYASLRWLGWAEVNIRQSRYPQALALLTGAAAAEAATGIGQFAAERHRLTGICQLAQSPSDAVAAESSFTEALAISRRQGAKALELRAALSLAGLWCAQGRDEPARTLLTATHAAFSEGLDGADLIEASDRLREIAERSGKRVAFDG